MIFDSRELSLAQKLDKQDSLKNFRSKFVNNNPDEIYLNGNSLGPLPIVTKERLEKVINNEWGERLVRGWQDGWFELSTTVGAKIAKIIGAKPNEVLVADSTSLNLYKLVFAALNFQKGRAKIVSDVFNFPSDLYILQGIIKHFGDDYSLQLVESRDNVSIQIEDIQNVIDDNTALVTLSHVCFKSGFLHDINEITKAAHKKGALVLWDLSHSGGVVDINLNETDVDLAIGCTYKYMNGGPGSPAYLFVKEELQEKMQMPVWGWLGEKNPFDFSINFRPANGIQKFQVGTPPIISLSGVDSSIDLILEAGIENIREKSIRQTEYLIYLSEQKLVPLGFEIQSPKNSAERGSHIALAKDNAFVISNALKNNDNPTVILDFRKPNILRLSASPLYNSFEEIWITVETIKNVGEKGNFKMNEDIRVVT